MQLAFFTANGVGVSEVHLVLNTYCLATEQRINYDKSSIYFSKGVSENVRIEIKGLLQVLNETLNDNILGYHLTWDHPRMGLSNT